MNSSCRTMMGLLGGTFNPIHFGHLRPTLDIAEQLDLDTVRIIPAHLPPLREQPTIKAQHRVEMVRLAIATEARFVLDTREFQRDKISYTIDTLRSLRQEVGEEVALCWIMGMDAYQQFTHWHQWQEILQLCHLVVAHRPTYSPNENKPLNRYHAEQRCELSHYAAGKIHFIAVTQLDISATMLRQHRKNNRSLRYLLPEAVHNYINENKLYL